MINFNFFDDNKNLTRVEIIKEDDIVVGGINYVFENCELNIDMHQYEHGYFNILLVQSKDTNSNLNEFNGEIFCTWCENKIDDIGIFYNLWNEKLRYISEVGMPIPRLLIASIGSINCQTKDTNTKLELFV